VIIVEWKKKLVLVVFKGVASAVNECVILVTNIVYALHASYRNEWVDGVLSVSKHTTDMTRVSNSPVVFVNDRHVYVTNATSVLFVKVFVVCICLVFNVRDVPPTKFDATGIYFHV
jgi:hypothetical protein